MTNFYSEYLIDKINNEVKENEIFVVKIYKTLFKKPYNLSSLSDRELNKLLNKIEFEKNILSSPLTLEEVSAILLSSELHPGGGSLQAFTGYICIDCGEENSWHNSNIPKTCNSCRNEKAMNVIQSGVLKRIKFQGQENRT